MKIEHEDLRDLNIAVLIMENPGLAAKLTKLIGVPVEKGYRLLPSGWREKVSRITSSALSKAATAALFTINDDPSRKSSNNIHKFAVATTGGLGGFFGLGAMVFEMPVSTTIILRSIADIARSEGERLSEAEAKMACMEVFALGNVREAGSEDEPSDTDYFVIRAGFASSVANAAEYISERGFIEGAPPFLRLIVKISERFTVQVSEKAVTQSIPFIGAAGGALINTLFMSHFQSIARAHFIIRRLERKYGEKEVRSAYRFLKTSEKFKYENNGE